MSTTQEKISRLPITKTRSISPNLLIAISAALSFLFSITLWFFVDKDAGLYVGIWVPSILSLGSFINVIREKK